MGSREKREGLSDNNFNFRTLNASGKLYYVLQREDMKIE